MQVRFMISVIAALVTLLCILMEAIMEAMAGFLNGKDVSVVKIALPPPKFVLIPDEKKL